MDSEKRPANSKEAEKLLVKHGKADYQFDDLLGMTGGFGRYQLALYTFICLVSIPTGAQLTIPVFYAISPPFTCASVSGNATCTVGKCCSSCVEYKFNGTFTSAVSEVRMNLTTNSMFIIKLNCLHCRAFYILFTVVLVYYKVKPVLSSTVLFFV